MPAAAEVEFASVRVLPAQLHPFRRWIRGAGAAVDIGVEA